ncbi:MAG: cell division protein FtsL [Candidatus Riflebacteria bacterium GWC2_50_8]|nr:MAG: cell division protein FtsL [Candidatus Riflebacteria bacterium GWC2_50_8]
MNKPRVLINSTSATSITRNTDREELHPAASGQRWHIIRLYLTAILLLSSMFTVYVWQSTKMVEVKLRIKSVENDINNLENANADLRGEISKLQSLARIESVAKNDLGMVEATRLVYITMPDKWNNRP